MVEFFARHWSYSSQRESPDSFIPIGINPYMGAIYTLKAFEIAVLGMFGAHGSKLNVAEASEFADRSLKLTGFYDQREKIAQNLTPVEKKMLEITRALAMKPELLLLDECMAGMPPKDIDTVVRFLKRIREEEGIAAIARVEHVMRALIGLTDKAVVLHLPGAKAKPVRNGKFRSEGGLSGNLKIHF